MVLLPLPAMMMMLTYAAVRTKKRITEERLKAYAEKKSKEPAFIAKTSTLCLGMMRPTLYEMLRNCKTIEMDGLLWGTSKLVPIGYSIKKLRLMAVVEDAQCLY